MQSFPTSYVYRHGTTKIIPYMNKTVWIIALPWNFTFLHWLRPNDLFPLSIAVGKRNDLNKHLTSFMSTFKHFTIGFYFSSPEPCSWKGTSRQRSGKGAIRKRFPLQKPRWEKTKLTIRYLYHETIVSRMGSYFPNRWPLSYLNLTKNMKTYIRRQQHKKFFKHQDIKQKEPPQKYRLGTISNTKLLAGLNRFYMAITSPSATAVVHNI